MTDVSNTNKGRTGLDELLEYGEGGTNFQRDRAFAIPGPKKALLMGSDNGCIRDGIQCQQVDSKGVWCTCGSD